MPRHQLNTYGGTKTWSAFSGGLLPLGSGGPFPPVSQAADNALIWSGAGRLNQAFPHQVLSGTSIVFYDSATPALSGAGNYSKSGYPVLGIIPANSIGAFGNQLGAGPAPVLFGDMFYSGLCVDATSGCPGFTVNFTPETQP